ncbi:protein FAR1-RELATED SEQUENCE 5-like [Humulus lupulus]|uniref:protein FAR1-RELATED SEQUENCE 5-like n=1 Tax=Humulus lupulus TaxID=3486 RepID=UPI002B41689D|nr:protein FAR1-RELATED SEQUENCE 5-like [Humulus lupulus]
MPFAPFTGLNNHKQSMLFGCALLADNTESTFIWLFTTWLEAMSGRQPGLIITEYDSAISRAAQQVFPHSVHRYCKWHIMSKMPKEMGLVYGALPRTFQMEFEKCVNKNESPDEFESTWQGLLDKHVWCSEKWKYNSLFDGYVSAGTALQDFAEQYEKALYDQYERSKGRDEVFESLGLAVKLCRDEEGITRYEVARFNEEHKVYVVEFRVSEQIASCDCKMFEFEGTICKHVLAVFKATNVFILPQHYIWKRWTRSAKDEALSDEFPRVGNQNSSHKGKNLQYNILYQEVVTCAEEGMSSDHIFKVALNALREARIKIVGAKKNAVNTPKLEIVANITNNQDDNNTEIPIK